MLDLITADKERELADKGIICQSVYCVCMMVDGKLVKLAECYNPDRAIEIAEQFHTAETFERRRK